MSTNPSTLLEQGAATLGLALTPAQLAAFEAYTRELRAWNQRANLTRITAPAEIVVKHYLDSLVLAPLLEGVTSLIDVGTGPGFPGVPLKIIRPALPLTLLEATGKKTDFLHHLIETLALPAVSIVTDRAEAAAHHPAHRARYGAAVARAVAALPTLAEYTLPFVAVGGLVLAQKGQDPAAEVEAAATALATLGGQFRAVRPLTVPGLDAPRHVALIDKVGPTPAKYPRRPGMPGKRPL